MPERPNIIYLVAHDLGRMLGCYGRGFESPNLDRFAREGAQVVVADIDAEAAASLAGPATT